MISSTHALGQGGPSRNKIVEPSLDIRIDECIIDEAAPSRINKIWANHSAKIQKHWGGQARDAGQGSWSAPNRRESHHFAFKRGSSRPFHDIFGCRRCEVVVNPKRNEDSIAARNRSAEPIDSIVRGGAAITQGEPFGLQIYPSRLVTVGKPIKGRPGQDSGSTAW